MNIDDIRSSTVNTTPIDEKLEEERRVRLTVEVLFAQDALAIEILAEFLAHFDGVVELSL